jgi:RND superfamily putative drug exporter
MDYQVFLLSRIRERYDVTGSTTDAVTFGVASTARIITGAALIIVAVFAGFARGDLVMFQQMGFGVAVALLLDATVIRSVVLPSAMKLLGEWNWYLPRWLGWLPRLEVEGPAPHAAHSAVGRNGQARGQTPSPHTASPRAEVSARDASLRD